MCMRDLMGASVEVAAAGFRVTDPTVDGPLPGGGGHLVAEPRRAILRVDEVGTFAIADGSLIRFDPDPDALPGAVSLWLHGSVAALLLAQRGRFALHASVVEVGGLGVAVAGPRGAGKSTTALRLAQRRHTLVTDDVSPLEAADPVTTHPFARPVHVFSQTADTLGIDVSDAQPLLPEHSKLALPVPVSAPVALGAIAVLGVGEGEAVLDTVRVHGAQAYWLVSLNVYRAELLGDLYRTEMFRWAGAVAQQVPVHAVDRPATGWTVDEVADAVERVAAEHRRR
jgi:hypothetical protein